MTETLKSSALEELLERIIRLEDDNACLHRKLSEVETAFQKDVVSISDHLVYLYQRLEDFLWPVLHKVFPNYGAAMEQSASILQKRASSRDE
jgi:hypothetical protein